MFEEGAPPRELEDGLRRSRGGFMSRLRGLLTGDSIAPETWAEVEEALIAGDVGAALDEANIGRFTDALRELSRTTQCIVITHNRGTIETADALYGVTVGDDSVSRVISLRLDEATALAERGTAPVAVPVGG